MSSSPPSPVAAQDARSFDLMRFRMVRALVLWRGFPLVFQIALLAAFVALVAIGWGVSTPVGVNSKLFAKSHLVTLLIWGLWWPAMVWAAVWLGRVWCTVCPLELVSRTTERLAMSLGFRPRPLPRWVAAGAVIVALYALLQMLVSGVQLHRVPAYTAWMLVALLLTAIVTGAVFAQRAFCRGFCPVGLLLGTYGRGGAIAIRANPVAAGGAPPDATVCPSLLNPAKLASNSQCVVCTQCVKAYPDRMQVQARWPFSASDARDTLASGPVTLFVMLVSGFVLSELFTEWPAGGRAYLSAPHWAAAKLGVKAPGWVEGAWILGLTPLLVWGVLGGVARLAGASGSLWTSWRRLALPIALIVSAGHLAKGLAKFVSWAPFLPYAVRDPQGSAVAYTIERKTMAAPGAWLPIGLVALIGASLLAAALLLAVREYRLAQATDRAPASAVWPLALLAAAYAGIVAQWAFR